MEAAIIKIGNSKGLRLSKTILEKYNIKDKVEMIFSNLMSIALEGESDISNREGHAQDGVQFLDKGEVLHKFFAPASSHESPSQTRTVISATRSLPRTISKW